MNKRSLLATTGAWESEVASILNVILLGKTGVGKSTFLNMLQNPKQVTERKVYSQTRQPELHTIVVRNTQHDKVWALRVIDTPGIFESREKASDVRSNTELLKLVYHCVDFHLTQINIVAITIRGDTGFNEQEVIVSNHLIDFLGPAFSQCAMLIVSNTESMPQNKREKYIQDLKIGDKTKRISDYCKLGVIFTGSIDADQLESFPDLRIPLENKVAELRTIALNTISSAPVVSLSKEVIQFAKNEREREQKAVEEKRRGEVERLKTEIEALKSTKNCVLQ